MSTAKLYTCTIHEADSIDKIIIDPQIIVCFTGVILEKKQFNIIIEFDKQKIKLRNDYLGSLAGCDIGTVARFYALMENNESGNLIALNPLNLEQFSRYNKLRSIEKLYTNQ